MGRTGQYGNYRTYAGFQAHLLGDSPKCLANSEEEGRGAAAHRWEWCGSMVRCMRTRTRSDSFTAVSPVTRTGLTT